MSTVMNPSAYSHFDAKASTLIVKALELHEGMSNEGASEEVLDAITQAHAACVTLQKTLRAASKNRENQMESDRLAARTAREAAATQRKAEAQAKKAAKAASAASTVVPQTVPADTTPVAEETAQASLRKTTHTHSRVLQWASGVSVGFVF